MTKRNKLIVGAVVVLGLLYLYDRNKKMKAVAELKAGAETTALGGGDRSTLTPSLTGGLKPTLVKNLRADEIMVTTENKFL
jgi:hypothetical protein